MSDGFSGTLRITGSRFELTVTTDDDRLVHIGLDLPPHTVHLLHRIAAVHVDPATGRCRRTGRPLLRRALDAVGACASGIEVLPGEPPRFVLVVVTADGSSRRVDLDVVDTAELLLVRGLPIRAIGWPEHDWDRALARLLDRR